MREAQLDPTSCCLYSQQYLNTVAWLGSTACCQDHLLISMSNKETLPTMSGSSDLRCSIFDWNERALKESGKQRNLNLYSYSSICICDSPSETFSISPV